MPFIPSNVDQLRDENTLVLKYVFISSLTPDLLLIPKSMPDKIIIILLDRDLLLKTPTPGT